MANNTANPIDFGAPDSSHQWMPSTEEDHLPQYIVVFVCLMVLLGLTVLAARIPFPPRLHMISLAIALVIAGIKAILVVLYFMHVKEASWLTWIFAGAALIWLAILIALTFGDYGTRESAPGSMKWMPTVVPYDLPATGPGHPFSERGLGEAQEEALQAAGKPAAGGGSAEAGAASPAAPTTVPSTAHE